MGRGARLASSPTGAGERDRPVAAGDGRRELSCHGRCRAGAWHVECCRRGLQPRDLCEGTTAARRPRRCAASRGVASPAASAWRARPSRAAPGFRRAGSVALDRGFPASLEARGWKGRSGSAIGIDAAQSRYFRSICANGARLGQLDMLGLYLDGVAIAIKCNFIERPRRLHFQDRLRRKLQSLFPGRAARTRLSRRVHRRPGAGPRRFPRFPIT